MSDGKNLSDRIADEIKVRIIKGEYKMGKQLPNEQVLSEELNVSRTTVREAVKILVSRNILEIERGLGTFVASAPGLNDDPFGLDFVPDAKCRADMCAFRACIEPSVYGLAARNASERQIKEMGCIIEQMERIGASVGGWEDLPSVIDSFSNLEIEYHTLVYRMTQNVVFDRLSLIISRSVAMSYTTLSYRNGFDFIETIQLHRSLYEAIAARDEAAAEKLGAAHMSAYPGTEDL